MKYPFALSVLAILFGYSSLSPAEDSVRCQGIGKRSFAQSLADKRAGRDFFVDVTFDPTAKSYTAKVQSFTLRAPQLISSASVEAQSESAQLGFTAPNFSLGIGLSSLEMASSSDRTVWDRWDSKKRYSGRLQAQIANQAVDIAVSCRILPNTVNHPLPRALRPH